MAPQIDGEQTHVVPAMAPSTPKAYAPMPAEEDTDLFQGCLVVHDGDEAKAQKHHQEVLRWRADMGINTILMEPFEHFEELKRLTPTFLCGRARCGSAVNYELVGEFDHPTLKKRYGNKEKLLELQIAMHTEYIRTVLHQRDSSLSEIIVMDFKGMTLSKLANPYLLTMTRLYAEALVVKQAHRIKTILCVNVPFGGSGAGILKRFLWVALPHAFADKLESITSWEQMDKYIAPEQRPARYGGTNDTPMPDWPEEVGLRELVLRNRQKE